MMRKPDSAQINTQIMERIRNTTGKVISNFGVAHLLAKNWTKIWNEKHKNSTPSKELDEELKSFIDLAATTGALQDICKKNPNAASAKCLEAIKNIGITFTASGTEVAFNELKTLIVQNASALDYQTYQSDWERKHQRDHSTQDAYRIFENYFPQEEKLEEQKANNQQLSEEKTPQNNVKEKVKQFSTQRPATAPPRKQSATAANTATEQKASSAAPKRPQTAASTRLKTVATAAPSVPKISIVKANITKLNKTSASAPSPATLRGKAQREAKQQEIAAQLEKKRQEFEERKAKLDQQKLATQQKLKKEHEAHQQAASKKFTRITLEEKQQLESKSEQKQQEFDRRKANLDQQQLANQQKQKKEHDAHQQTVTGNFHKKNADLAVTKVMPQFADFINSNQQKKSLVKIKAELNAQLIDPLTTLAIVIQNTAVKKGFSKQKIITDLSGTLLDVLKLLTDPKKENHAVSRARAMLRQVGLSTETINNFTNQLMPKVFDVTRLTEQIQKLHEAITEQARLEQLQADSQKNQFFAQVQIVEPLTTQMGVFSRNIIDDISTHETTALHQQELLETALLVNPTLSKASVMISGLTTLGANAESLLKDNFTLQARLNADPVLFDDEALVSSLGKSNQASDDIWQQTQVEIELVTSTINDAVTELREEKLAGTFIDSEVNQTQHQENVLLEAEALLASLENDPLLQNGDPITVSDEKITAVINNPDTLIDLELDVANDEIKINEPKRPSIALELEIEEENDLNVELTSEEEVSDEFKIKVPSVAIETELESERELEVALESQLIDSPTHSKIDENDNDSDSDLTSELVGEEKLADISAGSEPDQTQHQEDVLAEAETPLSSFLKDEEDLLSINSDYEQEEQEKKALESEELQEEDDFGLDQLFHSNETPPVNKDRKDDSNEGKKSAEATEAKVDASFRRPSLVTIETQSENNEEMQASLSPISSIDDDKEDLLSIYSDSDQEEQETKVQSPEEDNFASDQLFNSNETLPLNKDQKDDNNEVKKSAETKEANEADEFKEEDDFTLDQFFSSNETPPPNKGQKDDHEEAKEQEREAKEQEIKAQEVRERTERQTKEQERKTQEAKEQKEQERKTQETKEQADRQTKEQEKQRNKERERQKQQEKEQKQQEKEQKQQEKEQKQQEKEQKAIHKNVKDGVDASNVAETNGDTYLKLYNAGVKAGKKGLYDEAVSRFNLATSAASNSANYYKAANKSFKQAGEVYSASAEEAAMNETKYRQNAMQAMEFSTYYNSINSDPSLIEKIISQHASLNNFSQREGESNAEMIQRKIELTQELANNTQTALTNNQEAFVAIDKNKMETEGMSHYDAINAQITQQSSYLSTLKASIELLNKTLALDTSAQAAALEQERRNAMNARKNIINQAINSFLASDFDELGYDNTEVETAFKNPAIADALDTLLDNPNYDSSEKISSALVELMNPHNIQKEDIEESMELPEGSLLSEVIATLNESARDKIKSDYSDKFNDFEINFGEINDDIQRIISDIKALSPGATTDNLMTELSEALKKFESTQQAYVKLCNEFTPLGFNDAEIEEIANTSQIEALYDKIGDSYAEAQTLLAPSDDDYASKADVILENMQDLLQRIDSQHLIIRYNKLNDTLEAAKADIKTQLTQLGKEHEALSGSYADLLIEMDDKKYSTEDSVSIAKFDDFQELDTKIRQSLAESDNLLKLNPILDEEDEDEDEDILGSKAGAPPVAAANKLNELHEKMVEQFKLAKDAFNKAELDTSSTDKAALYNKVIPLYTAACTTANEAVVAAKDDYYTKAFKGYESAALAMIAACEAKVEIGSEMTKATSDDALKLIAEAKETMAKSLQFFDEIKHVDHAKQFFASEINFIKNLDTPILTNLFKQADAAKDVSHIEKLNKHLEDSKIAHSQMGIDDVQAKLALHKEWDTKFKPLLEQVEKRIDFLQTIQKQLEAILDTNSSPENTSKTKNKLKQVEKALASCELTQANLETIGNNINATRTPEQRKVGELTFEIQKLQHQIQQTPKSSPDLPRLKTIETSKQAELKLATTQLNAQAHKLNTEIAALRVKLTSEMDAAKIHALEKQIDEKEKNWGLNDNLVQLNADQIITIKRDKYSTQEAYRQAINDARKGIAGTLPDAPLASANAGNYANYQKVDVSKEAVIMAYGDKSNPQSQAVFTLEPGKNKEDFSITLDKVGKDMPENMRRKIAGELVELYIKQNIGKRIKISGADPQMTKFMKEYCDAMHNLVTDKAQKKAYDRVPDIDMSWGDKIKHAYGVSQMESLIKKINPDKENSLIQGKNVYDHKRRFYSEKLETRMDSNKIDTVQKVQAGLEQGNQSIEEIKTNFPPPGRR